MSEDWDCLEIGEYKTYGYDSISLVDNILKKIKSCSYEDDYRTITNSIFKYKDSVMILSISLDTFSTQNPKNHLFEMEQISMERSGMYICSISGVAYSGG